MPKQNGTRPLAAIRRGFVTGAISLIVTTSGCRHPNTVASSVSPSKQNEPNGIVSTWVSTTSLSADSRIILRPTVNSVLVRVAGVFSSGQARVDLLTVDGKGHSVPFGPADIAASLSVPADMLNLLDFLPLPNGLVLVLVNGWAGQRPLLGLWLYRPQDQALVCVADAASLGHVTGWGDSAALADGRLVGGTRGAWLCVSVFGQTSTVRVDFPASADALPDLRLAAERVTDEAGRPVGIEDASLWPAGDDSALLVKPGASDSYKIDLARGTAVAVPGGLPPLTVPTPAGPQTWVFTPAPPRPRTEVESWAADAVRRPTLTITPAGGKPMTIDRDGLITRLGFPVYAMRITAWCADANGRVLAYDAMSGEVFRMSLN